jgi:hypothetical protein
MEVLSRMQSTPEGDNPAAIARTPQFADRVLAEAVRAMEHDAEGPLNEPTAEEEARAVDGNFERRLIERAKRLSIAGPVRDALDQVWAATGWIIAVASVLALLTGAGAARTALGNPDHEPVNVFLVLAGLLGAQTALLVLWLVLMLARPRAANVSPLGAAVVAGGRWLAARVSTSPKSHQVAAIRAIISVNARGPIGRWSLSAISHLLWTLFNIGCVGLLLLLLSTRQYAFTWETTILSARQYEQITRMLAFLPDTAGFPVPTLDEVRQSEAGQSTEPMEAANWKWAGLLVGSLVLYGFAPRALLAGLSLSMRGRACRRFRLDTSAPEYARLEHRLIPRAVREGVERGDNGDFETRPPCSTHSFDPSLATGPPAIVGLELEAPAGQWPPRLHDLRWTDLGFVDTRDDRRRVFNALTALPEPPRVSIIVCALTTTPDRGVAAFIDQIREAARGPIALALSSGQSLRRRADGESFVHRVDDWRNLARSCGIEDARVVEVDLDHLTDVSRQRLAALIRGEATSEASGRHLEQAFELIGDAADSWSPSPDEKAQAELHRRIAALHGSDTRRWRDLLRVPGTVEHDLPGQLRSSADRMLTLLPDRLKASPKWMAAGATAGALSCVAATMLLSPAAIGALPMWSGLGAAIAGVSRAAMGDRDRTPESAEDIDRDRSRAIRAATLFALLLELQGRDEAAISRVLDRALPEADDEMHASGAGDVRGWLDDVRHRFDIALAPEATS